MEGREGNRTRETGRADQKLNKTVRGKGEGTDVAEGTLKNRAAQYLALTDLLCWSKGPPTDLWSPANL